MLAKSNTIPRAADILCPDDPKAKADRELKIEIRLEELKEKQAKDKIKKMQAVVDSLDSEQSDSESAEKVKKQNETFFRQFGGTTYFCTRCKKGFSC